MEKLYYTIGEVAEILGEQVSLVRFWNNTYPKLFSAKRNAKGNRLYVKEDVETFRQLHYLVKEKGMKLEGAVKLLKEERAEVKAKVKVLDSRRSLRERLVEIRKSLP